MALAYRAGAPPYGHGDGAVTTPQPSRATASSSRRPPGARARTSSTPRGSGLWRRTPPICSNWPHGTLYPAAEQTEINAGRDIDGCVLLDLRHLGREKDTRAAPVHQRGIDGLPGASTWRSSRCLVRPGMHYQMGGVKTDVDGATSVPGLYAAGECACVQRPRRQPAGRELTAGHHRLWAQVQGWPPPSTTAGDAGQGRFGGQAVGR